MLTPFVMLLLAPIGTNTAPKRTTGLATVRCNAVRAGTIASSSGSAKVVPTPRRTVRLGRYFFVTNIAISLSLFSGGRTHLERSAPHHADDERRPTIAASGCLASHASNRRHVVVLDAAPQRIGH